MKSKVRWVPAKASLGQNQFITEQLRAPAEPVPTVPAAVPTSSTVQAVPGDTKTIPNGLLYGGVILAGLGIAWLITRKS